MRNKGKFTKKNAAYFGRMGGKKTLRKYGKRYYRELSTKST